MKKYSKLPGNDRYVTNIEKSKKPLFEATSYLTFYAAANEEDAAGKECDFILDRKEMWNCTMVNGSKSSYEFSALAEVQNGEYNNVINIRYLPCPCAYCNDRGEEAYDANLCSNRDIVGAKTRSSILFKSPVIVPEIMNEPLEQYTNDELIAYIKVKSIKCKGTRKYDYCRAIRQDNLV